MAAARCFLASSLADWDQGPQLEVVVLLTSEVVTNVVLHAGPHGQGEEIAVGVHLTANLVRVEVTDSRPGTLSGERGASDGLSGRGLVLLDALASAWGVAPAGPGKVVWFEVQA